MTSVLCFFFGLPSGGSWGTTFLGLLSVDDDKSGLMLVSGRGDGGGDGDGDRDDLLFDKNFATVFLIRSVRLC